MMETFNNNSNVARLFYKNTCPPCRWMSKLAVILSLGTIRRVPIQGTEAATFYKNYPAHEGQLVLIQGHHITFGRKVFAGVPKCIVTAWWLAIKKTAVFS